MPALSRQFSGSWVWMLGLFTFASLVEGIAISHMTTFIPLHLPSLGVPESDVARVTGLVVAISSAIGVPFVPLWGALADRYARQPVIVRSFLFYCAALVIMVVAQDVWLFIAGRALLSFTMGNTGLMLTTLTERAPRTRTGLAFTMVEGAIPLGASIGPFLGGPILDTLGFRALVGIDAALMALVIVSVSFGYKDAYRLARRDRSLLAMSFDSFRIIFSSSRLVTLFSAILMLFTGTALGLTFTPIAILEFYDGADAGTVVGLVFGAAGIVTLVVSPGIGLLADRFGHWRMLFFTLITLALLWYAPAVAPSLFYLGLIWAVLSALSTAALSLSFSIMSTSVREEVRGRIMALSTVPLFAGYLIGPAIGSVVANRNVFAVYPIAALMTAFGLLLMVISSRRSTGIAEEGQ